MRIKRSTIAATVPTLGNNDDHTDGSWSDEDIYTGEFFFNVPDKKLWIGGELAPEELAFKSDIVASQDLGSSDLVSADQVRLFQLFGNTLNDNLTIVNASLQTVAQFKGDRNTWLAGANTLIGSGGAPSQLTFGGNNATIYAGNGNYLDTVVGYRHRFYTYGTLKGQWDTSWLWMYTGLKMQNNNIEAGTGAGTKIGTAASQKLALFGATPIVQPTTAHASATETINLGSNITNTSTFDGYTLAQIVKALRDLGILQ